MSAFINTTIWYLIACRPPWLPSRSCSWDSQEMLCIIILKMLCIIIFFVSRFNSLVKSICFVCTLLLCPPFCNAFGPWRVSINKYTTCTIPLQKCVFRLSTQPRCGEVRFASPQCTGARREAHSTGLTDSPWNSHRKLRIITVHFQVNIHYYCFNYHSEIRIFTLPYKCGFWQAQLLHGYNDF